MKISKTIHRILALLLAIALLPTVPLCTAKAEEVQTVEQEKVYRIWFDEAAPWTVEGFERWSLPLGNGYMGINVFGGVETELLSVTENSLFNPAKSAKGTDADGDGVFVNDFGDERIDSSSQGLNLFAKTYIDFPGHDTANVSNYKRELSLEDSLAKVSYELDGVTYSRAYFSTYPDKVTVMRLSASEAGKLSFVLRPEIPYCYDPEVDANKYSYLSTPGDGYTKTGKVTAEGDTITLKGTMDYFGTDFEGLYKVIPTGGTMVAANDANGKNGTITVENADSVLIILAVGTNYSYEYSTFNNAKGMLNNAPDPHEKVQGYLDAAAQKSYEQLLAAHQADHKEFFDRADVDLGGVYDSTVTTDALVNGYGTGNTGNDRYLEELTFQFGRYLLIASSREGCLPSNLQGIWNFADSAAWSGGYWHNINVQMNYWPAFNTNLAELFKSYADYNEAMRGTAQTKADAYLKTIASPTIATAGTGENGYTIGTGCSPYTCASASTTGHSGPGTVAFTSLLFWDWYEYTQDRDILENHTYPALEGAAKFLSKTVKEYDDGTMLVYNSKSPENGINNVYVQSVGTAFDQEMVYANHLATKLAAEKLGYTAADAPILTTIDQQIHKLDPVKIGYSGQVKEYREENYYGEYGEKAHRHISQLVGVYPATLINGNTDAWLDAAAVSLENRGYTNIAWGVIHRMLCWARIQDGEQAYEELQLMMKQHLGYSLLSNYNDRTNPAKKSNDPFQIEANFGYTAAVAEMLVQSQAGYIEFLPALPAAWADGSFEGLTTRGNFAVDATWENGIATGFAIESRSGVECAVKYPNIASAVVKDSKGNTVSFTADGDDLISFATTAGETYTITGIPAHTPNLAAPTALTLAASGSKMDLSWTASEGAVSYNVYRAINDAPSYELVEDGITGTTYTYEPADIRGADRVTMRVVAVAADGTESSSALAYSLPLTPLENVTGYMLDGKDLQLSYAPQDDASEYRVYENGTLISTSKYAIAAVKNADPTAVYAVSVVVDGRESAATVAEISSEKVVNKIALLDALHSYAQQDVTASDFAGVQVAYILAEAEARRLLTDENTVQLAVDKATQNLTKAATEANIFKNQSVAVNLNHIGSYAPDKMVDGDMTASSRWAVSEASNAGTTENHAVVTITLDGLYHLGGVFVQEYLNDAQQTNGGSVTIEVSTDGSTWTTVLSGVSLQEYRDSKPIVNSSNTGFVFENSVLAKQVRLTFDDSLGSSKAITIFEIQGYGSKVDESKLYLSSDLLTLASGKTHTLTASTENVSWASSDSNVVSVDATGKLTAHHCGKATVTASDAGGNTASCAITVITDTTQLKAAIVTAETAMDGVVSSDRLSDKVPAGTKFVPTAIMENLQNTLAAAKALAEAPTDAAEVNTQTEALNTATATFVNALQTGTMPVTGHSHCVCTGTTEHTCQILTWTAWGDDAAELTSLPTATGNYFLVADIETNKEYNIGNDQPTVTVNLCLNGFNIVGKHTDSRVYNVYSTLNICDCSEESRWGKISGSDTSYAVLQLRDIRENKGTVNLYSGIITAEEGTVCTDGGLIRLGNSNTNGSVFNMYGGKLTGGNSASGGAVNILSKSTFNMYGGEISGNTATNGGAFYSKGTIHISGGTVIGSKTTLGGCIYAESGTVNISGGTLTGGFASTGGGLIYMAAGDLNITGGTLSDSSCNGRGGVISVITGTLEMSNVNIAGIQSKYGAVLDIRKGSTATISDCSFTGCSTTNSGGVFFVDGATVTVDNCVFDGNTCATNGGNLYLQGGGKLTVTNSEVINGKGAKGSDIYVSSGTATLENVTVGTANGDTDLWLQGGTLNLGKGMIFTGSITDLYKNAGTLKLAADFSPNRVLTADAKSTLTTLCAATSQQGAMFIGATNRSVTYDGTNVVFTDPTVALCGDTTTAYGSVWAAMQAMTEGQYIKLTADTTENITVSDALYLDLNGKTLTGNITGVGTLYGMDSATDGYCADNIGRVTGTVSCAVAGNFKTDVTGAVRRYMAIADEAGYTFHRFYLGITHMNVKPTCTGVGYKAVFYGDETVLSQVTGYGYNLWVGDGEKLSAGKDGAFTSGKTVTLRLQNFDVANYGEEPVYGQVYITLADGSTVTGGDCSYTLRFLVETVAANISNYSETQLSALRTMLETNSDATADWNIDSLR